MEDVSYVTFYWTNIIAYIKTQWIKKYNLKLKMFNVGEHHSSVFGIMNTPLPLETCQCHMHRSGWNLSLGRQIDIIIFNFVFTTHIPVHTYTLPLTYTHIYLCHFYVNDDHIQSMLYRPQWKTKKSETKFAFKRAIHKRHILYYIISAPGWVLTRAQLKGVPCFPSEYDLTFKERINGTSCPYPTHAQ